MLSTAINGATVARETEKLSRSVTENKFNSFFYLQVTRARETSFGSTGEGHAPNHFKTTPVSFVYRSKEHVRIWNILNFILLTFLLEFQGCRHQRFDDTLKRKRKQSVIGKHYSTWHDKVCFSTIWIFARWQPFMVSFSQLFKPNQD